MKSNKLPTGETSLREIADKLGCSWSALPERYPDLFPDGMLHYEYAEDSKYNNAKKGDKRSFNIINTVTTIYKTNKKADHFVVDTRIKLIPRYSIKALYER